MAELKDENMDDSDRNLVDLINKLAEYANDENSTKEAIDNLVGRIRNETSESIKREMDNASEEVEKSKNSFPDRKVADQIRKAMLSRNDEKIIEQIRNENMNEDYYLGQYAKDTIVFTRTREVAAPGKAHPTDAGIDFYVPDAKAWTEEFRKMVVDYSRNPKEGLLEFKDDNPASNPYIVVQPGGHVAIPSGIKTILPPRYGMMFVNKSGVATKLKLDHSACLVDAAYRDEIVMCFFNHSTVPIQITPGMKITQGLIVPIINLEVQEVLNRVYDTIGAESDRGGGFGSSGTSCSCGNH